jgi:hypothetical protein
MDRDEVTITTVMVSGVSFSLADHVIRQVVTFLLGIVS